MFDNVFAILFGIIDIQEPAIAEDDTALFSPVADEPPTMRISKISLVGLQTLDQLCGCLVAYRMDCFSEWQVGHIRGVEEGKFGRVSVYFVPSDETLISKWRDLDDLRYVVWE